MNDKTIKTLQVFNEFDVEDQPQCTYDHLELYDGKSVDDTSLGKFCGNKKPDAVVATGSEMFIKFFSDASVQKRGFSATHTTGSSYFKCFLLCVFSPKLIIIHNQVLILF